MKDDPIQGIFFDKPRLVKIKKTKVIKRRIRILTKSLSHNLKLF